MNNSGPLPYVPPRTRVARMFDVRELLRASDTIVDARTAVEVMGWVPTDSDGWNMLIAGHPYDPTRFVVPHELVWWDPRDRTGLFVSSWRPTMISWQTLNVLKHAYPPPCRLGDVDAAWLNQFHWQYDDLRNVCIRAILHVRKARIADP